MDEPSLAAYTAHSEFHIRSIVLSHVTIFFTRFGVLLGEPPQGESEMNIRVVLSFGLVLSALALAANAAEEKKEPAKPAAKDVGLDRFKQLEGTWIGKAGEGKDAHETKVTYKVTSNGTAVVETIVAGDHGEMITVIHQDGDALALTHYCALGNQPRMKANHPTEGKSVAFKFTGASNLKSDKDMHMHDVTYTFVDDDTLQAEWTHYMDGKEGGKVMFEVKRAPKK
jgi:hypothetical protein